MRLVRTVARDIARYLELENILLTLILNYNLSLLNLSFFGRLANVALEILLASFSWRRPVNLVFWRIWCHAEVVMQFILPLGAHDSPVHAVNSCRLPTSLFDAILELTCARKKLKFSL
jgi:hypothetical protein